MGDRLRAQKAVREAKESLEIQLFARDKSQRITRLNVMRDTIAKQLMGGLNKDTKILNFPSAAFTLYIGKTTNLATVKLPNKLSESFIFPKKYQLAGDSADGYGYVYVEYNSNIYYWANSKNSPPGEAASKMITLLLMKQNGTDLDESSTEEPIIMFADKSLFSNSICLYWDRFVPNTPGGDWSTRGVTNNGDGCITTHLTVDMAVFVDGKVPSGSILVDVASRWDREVWETSCIGCGDEKNLVVVAVLGMVLFTNMLLIMLGFVVDGTHRVEMEKKKVASRYHFDGDGITSPMNLDDPIAYAHADSNTAALFVGTLWNVTKREHAMISVAFYNENFTRPQRLQCFTSLLCGLLAINAAVQSNPGYYQEARTSTISGVLSGLLLFPIYCGLLLMFNARPRPVKKKLIKRATQSKEIDMLNEERQKLGRQTALLPPPSYAAKALGSMQHQPGGSTVLGVQAALPLPPLPDNTPGGRWGATGMSALPPLPTSTSGSGAQGLAALGGMLSLPALPGMTAKMPLPPPPRYPPPPKNALMAPPQAKIPQPPLNFTKVGPPPSPFKLPLLLNQDGTIGGTNTNQLGSFDGIQNQPINADTGATPLAIMAGADNEATPPPPGAIMNDPGHGMAAEDDDPKNGGDGGEGATTPVGPPPLPTPQTAAGAMSPARGGGTPVTPGAQSSVGSQRGGFPQPGAGVGGLSPANSHRSNNQIRTPPVKSGPHMLAVQGPGPMPLFIRAAPPSDMPAPFAPAPVGPSGLSSWRVPGVPAPGMLPPVPSAKGFNVGMPLPPLVPPPPPPPPREEDQAFVYRVKLAYKEKCARERERFDLLEDLEELGSKTPGWVYDTMTVMPYLACCTFTLASVFVVLQYGTKFQSYQEDLWLEGAVFGLVVDCGLLELFRILMMTLVELRKYENRKKSKAGFFMPRRIASEDDKGRQIAPRPRLMKRAFSKPAVPKFEPASQVPGEQFLVAMGLMRPPPPPPGGVGKAPPKRPPMVSKSNMALAPPPPPDRRPSPRAQPTFSTAAMNLAFSDPPAPGAPSTPPRALGPGNSPSGRATPTRSPGGGTPRDDGGTPVMSRTGTPRADGVVTPPGRPPRPPDLQSMNQSLNQAVKAKAPSHQAPPPPKMSPGRTTPGGSTPPPPPPGAGPSFSRPSSAGSTSTAKARAKAAAAKAPPPPP
jgi:hypothetical protein